MYFLSHLLSLCAPTLCPWGTNPILMCESACFIDTYSRTSKRAICISICFEMPFNKNLSGFCNSYLSFLVWEASCLVLSAYFVLSLQGWTWTKRFAVRSVAVEPMKQRIFSEVRVKMWAITLPEVNFYLGVLVVQMWRCHSKLKTLSHGYTSCL